MVVISLTRYWSQFPRLRIRERRTANAKRSSQPLNDFEGWPFSPLQFLPELLAFISALSAPLPVTGLQLPEWSGFCSQKVPDCPWFATHVTGDFNAGTQANSLFVA